MKTYKLLALIISVFTVGMVQAQEAQTITLQQAITYALEHKADAKKAKLEIENAEYRIDETRGAALPQVNGTGSITYNPLLQKTALPAEFGALIGKPGEAVVVAFGQKWQSTANVAVTQQIFNQALFTGLKAAKSTREFYEINSTLTDEQLIERVANAYYQVFQAQLQLQTIDINLENTTKTHKVIEGLVNAGLAKKIDLDRLAVNINNLKASRQQVVNSLEQSENALKFAMGMDITQPIVLPKETFDVDLSKYIETESVDGRTEVKLQQKQLELLELNRKATIAERYPILSFTGNLGYLGMGNHFPIFSSASGVNWSPFSGIGLNLAVPIFKGGSTKAKINQRTIDIKKAQVDLENIKLGLQLEVENAKSTIRNNLLTVESNRRNVGMAKDVLSNTENNYRNGLATLTDLLDAEKAYADAQNNLNTSLLNYKVAEIQMIKANGQLKTLVNK